MAKESAISKKIMATGNALSENIVTVEIIQDNFETDTERKDFTQAIKMHGITFLYFADEPIQRPTAHDLNLIERIARPLANFWPQALVIGGSHE